MHAWTTRKKAHEYLDKAIPPVVVLIEVFTKRFKGGGDRRCHRGPTRTRDWLVLTTKTTTTTTAC